jgi:hypothetical protein
MRPLVAALALLCLLSLGARADEHLEAALYWGRNTPPPMLAHTAPPELEQRLHQVFGFRDYQLVKSDRIDLDRSWSQWFIPRKDFFLRIDARKPQADEPRLIDYEIYQDGFILAKGKYEPSEGTPLFINGPDFKSGRLILVLEPH